MRSKGADRSISNDFKSIMGKVEHGLKSLYDKDLCVTDYHYIKIGLLHIKAELEQYLGKEDERIETSENILKYYEMYLSKNNPYLGKEYVTLGLLESAKANDYKMKIGKYVETKNKEPPKKWFARASKYFKRAVYLKETGLKILGNAFGAQSVYITAHEKAMQEDIANGKATEGLKEQQYGIAKSDDGTVILGNNAIDYDDV